METELIEKPVKNKFKRIDMGFMSMRLPNGLPRFAILPYGTYQNAQVSIISQWVGTQDGRTPIRDWTMENQSWTPTFERGWITRNGRFVRPQVRDDSWRRDARFLEDYFQSMGIFPHRSEVEDLVSKIPDPEMVMINLPDGMWAQAENQQFFSAEPSSAVPEIVRETNWTAQGFTNLRVAWEATWKAIKVANMRESVNPLDPILIGERDGKHWILATWDLTKLESYVVDAGGETYGGA